MARSGGPRLLVARGGGEAPGSVGTFLGAPGGLGATGAVPAASGQSGTASPFSPKALRASAGAALHLPILAGMSLPILLSQLRVANVRTLATSVHEKESPVGARSGASQSLGAQHVAPQRGKMAPLLAPWEID